MSNEEPQVTDVVTATGESRFSTSWRGRLLAHPLVLGLAFVLTPAIWRTHLMLQAAVPLRLIDLRGYASDFAAAALFYGICLLVSKNRWLLITCALLWSILIAGVFEHARVLHAWPNINNASFLTDPTFVTGSAIRFSHAGLLTVMMLSLSLLAAYQKRPASKSLGLASLAICLCSSVILLAIEVQPASVSWRQTSAAEQCLVDVLAQARGPVLIDSPLIDQEEIIERATSSDVEGEPIVPIAGKKLNVLLILVEGASGAYVPTIRNHHRMDVDITMPYVDELCEDYLCYGNFISQQRQTNRGEYAVLAGDHPRLLQATPKMTDFSLRPEQVYLPKFLQQQGYTTCYIQAADLSFMMKDQFMPAAGFEHNYGRKKLSEGYRNSNWGVDDLSFFEQSLEIIQDLDRESPAQPWFVTLLTVSTHHPYIVPADYERREGEDDFERSFRYADDALRYFINALREAKLLEDTLVVVSSDESAGLLANPTSAIEQLCSNWGLLILMTPERHSRFILEPFAQHDLALSVVDYLGLADLDHPFSGRSAFRSYNTRRPIFFGNTYQRHLGYFGTDDRIRLYTSRLEGKWQASHRPQALFDFALDGTPPADAALVGAMAHRVQQTTQSENRIALVRPQRVPLPVGKERVKVIDGQYLGTAQDAVFTFTVVAEAEGPPGCSANLTHELRTKGKKVFSETGQSAKRGQTYQFTLHYRTGGPQDAIEFKQWLHNLTKRPMQMKLIRTDVVIQPYDRHDHPALKRGEAKATYLIR